MRTCSEDTWSAWSGCTNEGACVPDSSEDCGKGRVRRCSANCDWSACQGVCEGVALRAACGNCGTRVRTCSPDSGPSEWSPCHDEGGCMPGTVQDCLTPDEFGLQTCGDDCNWGSCDPPSPPSADQEGPTSDGADNGSAPVVACGACTAAKGPSCPFLEEVTWSCADSIDPKFADALARAGCRDASTDRIRFCCPGQASVTCPAPSGR